MSMHKTKKFGFFISLTMLVGTVVGIGIFLKNHSILKANSWSGTGTLTSWLVGGLLSLAAAISFSEISSFDVKKYSGLGGWAGRVGGEKFGFFARFNYTFFYLAILNVVISFFASETLISIFASILKVSMSEINLGYHFFVAFVILIFFVIMNKLSTRTSGFVQSTTLVLKFIPLILVGVLGIVLATTNNHPSTSNGAYYGQNAFTNGVPFDFTKMLAALPAVLFAFDAFLVVGGITKKMKHPKKLPTVVFVGMLTIFILYLLIALSAILHGSGLVSGAAVGAPATLGLGIFDQIFTNDIAAKMGTFVIVFISVSTFGVLNGLTAGTISLFDEIVENEEVFGARKLKSVFGDKGGLILTLGVTSILMLIIGIPAIVVQNDALIDAISNFPTLFYFGIYATIILLYTLKRKTFATLRIFKIAFYTSAIFAIIGIFFLVGYQLFYGLSTNLFMHASEESSAGLFAKATNYIVFTQLHLAITFFVMLVIFITLPSINLFLKHKIENQKPFKEAFSKAIKLKK